MSSSSYSNQAKRFSRNVATRSILYVIACSVPLSFGCGGSADNGGGTTSTGGTTAASTTGGTSSTGGTHATGGSSKPGTVQSGGAATGGASSIGGSSANASSTGGAATGGGSSKGGAATGGGSSKGGAATGGGSSKGGAATGGGSSIAGAATGGAGKGGDSSNGGTSATAGAGKGGSSAAGAATGGAAGSQGSGSPGCGITSPLKTGNFTESINGTSRKWMLDVPTGYDATKKYRLIFVWHPLGGSGSQIVSGGFNGLKSLANNTAIFATADGLNGSNSEASGTGWWNANGGDMKLLQVMLDKINAGLCVDQERIFSTGFSFGGMMSYTVGFQFDVFRAVAPCSGKTGIIPYDDNNDAPLPIMAFHGDKDTFVATSLGKAFLDMYAKRNKCGTQTQPVDPSPCVQYQDCVVPTIWCVFPGAHETWSQEPQAIWKFFSQF